MKETEIAKRINVNQSTIAQYVSGRALPGLDTFANLCITLDINPADLLGINKTLSTNTKAADGLSSASDSNENPTVKIT